MASVKYSDLHKYITGMLENADLSVLSSKMIRKRCEEKFKTDLSSRKKEIDDIVMAFVHKENSDQNESNSDQNESNSDQGESNSDQDEKDSDENKSSSKELSEQSESDSEHCRKDQDEDSPKRKIPKKLPNTNMNKKIATVMMNSNQNNAKMGDDAALAKQLQEEEWNFRSRASRRASRGSKSSAVKHKTKDENKATKVRKGTSTYSKKCLLSTELAEIMECDEMARPEIVKKMWAIVRERDLFDPSNKRYVFCDDQLIKVFGQKRIRMFSMMKYLRNHIKDKV